MKFTDLFIRRPVLAIVVNLVILLAGFQAWRVINVRQYPRSDLAVISVTTAYVGANADLVRGFVTTPLERVIASAEGIDFVESASAQGVSTISVHLQLNYDTNAALDPDSGQGRPGAQRPAARGGGAGHQRPDRGRPHRLDVRVVLFRHAGG